MAIKRGTQVRQKVQVITGQVMKTEYNEDAEQLHYLVEYADEDGDPASRWFNADQVEEVPGVSGEGEPA